jgi:asparagine synthase (glutamine-hydrolysing)
MCGIHGAISFSGPIRDAEKMAREMGDAIIHRGPDDSGAFVDESIFIAMRRLSIIDLDTGHQPISNEDNTIWLVCNGEIYNFQELRKDLIYLGHQFKTGSDSEVIIHLYEEYGENLVNYLNGMFAFALWDGKKKKLVIGRDQIGIKPLYYYQDSQRLIFASELKSILTQECIPRTLNKTAIGQYFTYGYVPAPYSIFENIYKLEPATLITISNNVVEFIKYWKLPQEQDDSKTEEEWSELTYKKIEESVKRQMVSDVPLGAFLSGGIDSSAVVSMMAKNSNKQINTYAIGFEGSRASDYYNELQYAGMIARQFNTNHHEIIVNPDIVSLLPKLLWHMDEPISDSAFVTTYLVSEFSRNDVTVILSGVGGDELFGGYRRYLGEYYSGLYKKIPGSFKKIIKYIVNLLPSDRHSSLLNLFRYSKAFVNSADLSFSDKYQTYMQLYDKKSINLLKEEYRPSDNFDALIDALKSENSSDSLHLLFATDLNTQLPDDLLFLTDKMSMATSLECRVPLLDRELVEMAATMPGHFKIKDRELKHILKKSLEQELPNEILYRKKRGFGAPMGAWVKGELIGLINELLSEKQVRMRGVLEYTAVQKILFEHQNNINDYTDLILAMINFEIWARIFVDGESYEDLSRELKERVLH